MEKTILLSPVILMALLPCTSHKSGKNEPKPVLNPSQEKRMAKKVVIDASDYTEWVYINFDKGEVVGVSTPETDLSWDLGLHRYGFRTSSGTSDKDRGAAARTSQEDLMIDIPIPKGSEWALDREGILLMKFDMNRHEMKYEKQPANFLLTSEPEDDGKGYLNKGIVGRVGMPPTVMVNPSVFLARSVTGQVVRVRVLDYQNATKKAGYIILEYIVKADKK